jgi:hypothetical protein
MIRRTPPLSIVKIFRKIPQNLCESDHISRREITGRQHRPSIIYIEEYPGFLPAFLPYFAPRHIPLQILKRFQALTIWVRVSLPGMKIR